MSDSSRLRRIEPGGTRDARGRPFQMSRIDQRRSRGGGPLLSMGSSWGGAAAASCAEYEPAVRRLVHREQLACDLLLAPGVTAPPRRRRRAVLAAEGAAERGVGLVT